jgi:hypothetical protein
MTGVLFILWGSGKFHRQKEKESWKGMNKVAFFVILV